MNSFGLEGYTMGFDAMNLDKTKHVCKHTSGMAHGEAEALEEMERGIVEGETNYGDDKWYFEYPESMMGAC